MYASSDVSQDHRFEEIADALLQGRLSLPPTPSMPIVHNDTHVHLDDRDRVARADWSHLRAYAVAAPNSCEIQDAFRYDVFSCVDDM